MGEINKRFIQKQDFFIDTEDLSISYACANEIDCKNIVNKLNELASENEELKQLAEGNEEQLLKVMSYLHDNHYELWEKVNKDCF